MTCVVWCMARSIVELITNLLELRLVQQHILSLAQKLISIPSIAGNKEASDDVLIIAKEVLGDTFSIEKFKSNKIPSLLVSNTSKPTKHFKIILNEHLDVVPGTLKQCSPVVKVGKLFGRGGL